VTIAANLVFLFFSHHILFKDKDYSRNIPTLVVLFICTGLIINQLYNIVFVVWLPLVRLTDDVVWTTLAYLYTMYGCLVLGYLIATWVRFRKLRIALS
jgi:hypothetical protein